MLVVGRLISLYVRAGAGAANLALRTAARGAELALSAVQAVVPYTGNGAPSSAEDVFRPRTEPIEAPAGGAFEDPERSPAAEPPEAAVEEAPSRQESAVEPQAAIDYDSEPPTPLEESVETAKTIDDEPELVAEFAEPGAEDGASAELEVDEPWDGYDELNADDVVARISDADTAALAVVELYERTHRDRRMVLAAVETRQRVLENAP